MGLKRRYLPSLGSFATFEVAAKHLSFTQAGQELNVTQAAISQQIRGLEKALGVTLFERKHGGLDLTPQGRRLLDAVGTGLDAICDAVDDINNAPDQTVITCSGTNAAVAYWFRPLIDRFRRDRPGARFTLLASDEDDALSKFDEVDVALICGNERSDVGEQLHYLFPEVVEPVCSPAYLAQRGPFPDPASIARADILELHPKHWSSEAIGWLPLSWSDWFQSCGLAPPDSAPVLVSNSYPVLVDAALAGQGIVLGWRHLVAPFLADGRLCRASDRPLRVERGNYLKVNRAALVRPDVRAFVDLILSEARITASRAPWHDSPQGSGPARRGRRE